MTRRDRDRERAFLADAARGHRPLVDHALARLDAGDELYGDSWAWIGIRKHLAELLEEAADLGAWAVLAHQALDHEPRLSAVDRQRVAGVVAAAAAHGARAHAALTAAVTALGTPADGEAVA
jgi:hypothetical protein